MNRRHSLLTHPVGRLSSAARWYLAGIAMLTLVLIAIHFAMQVYAQQEAKRLVASWAKGAGISVSDVRYRMLRGALTLVDVRLKRDSIDIDVPTVFLHGSLASLGDASPVAGYVEIRGANIKLPIQSVVGMANGDAKVLPRLFYQVWSSAKRVGIYDSHLQIVPGRGGQLPAEKTDIAIGKFEAEQYQGRRDIKGSLTALEGELKLVSQVGPQDDPNQSSGKLTWNRIDAASLFAKAMGFKSIPGTLNGQIEWKMNVTESGSYRVDGVTEIEGGDGVEKRGRLDWQGLLFSEGWTGEINATSWPLAPFSEQLPQYQHYQITSGNVNGAFKFAGGWRAWKIDAADTLFSNVEYSREEESELLPDWRLGALRISDASLHWPERTLRAKKASLEGFDFVTDSRGVESDFQNWKVDVKEISLRGLSPSIILSNQLFRLPELSGTARWRRGDRLSFTLRSPESEGSEERWKVDGEGSLSAKNGDRLKIDVSSKQAALVRFRPLLPDQLRKGASSVTGLVDLNLSITAGSLPWEGSGGAELSDIYIQYGGEQLSAKHAVLDVEQIGAALPEQRIRQVDIMGWAYQAPLRPLAQSQLNDANVEDVPISKAEPWLIQSLQMSDGRVMVGSSKAVWLQATDIHVKNLHPGSDAPINLKAEMGGGTLVVQGSLRWDEAMPELRKAKVVVRDALPFFMNEWFSISGVPELTRGRVYADLKLDQNAVERYEGVGYFRLQHGLLAPAHSDSDLFLSRTGFNTHDIFSTLNRAGQLRVRVLLQGEGGIADLVGGSLVAALKASMEKRQVARKLLSDSKRELISSVRLHEKGVLSYNERVRLRKTLAYLKMNPKVAVELHPQLAMAAGELIEVKRVRYTQQLIENFLTKRGISRARIFPVWPDERHRNSKSSSGIAILTMP